MNGTPKYCAYTADETWHDDEFGDIQVSYSNRAKRLKLRIEVDKLILVLPADVGKMSALRFINQTRERIRAVQKRVKTRAVGVIDQEHPLQTLSFTTSISATTERKVIHYRLAEKTLHIEVPAGIDITAPDTQTRLKKGIEHFLRLEAKRLLPPRLDFLANKWGFEYKDVKIQSSHGRWGSCSSKGNINLSMFILLLTPELADSVMLHELCHTKEMNHGPRFWALMEKVTEGRAKELRLKINKYPCGL